MKQWMLALAGLLFLAGMAQGATDRISSETQACLGCHASAFPGIVADWQRGRMGKVTPRAAISMISKKRFTGLTSKDSDTKIQE